MISVNEIDSHLCLSLNCYLPKAVHNYFEFVFFPIDNHRRNLLIQKDQDGSQDSGDH